MKLGGIELKFKWFSVNGRQLTRCVLPPSVYSSKSSFKLDCKNPENWQNYDYFKKSQLKNIFGGFSGSTQNGRSPMVLCVGQNKKPIPLHILLKNKKSRFSRKFLSGSYNVLELNSWIGLLSSLTSSLSNLQLCLLNLHFDDSAYHSCRNGAHHCLWSVKQPHWFLVTSQ